MMTQQPLLDPTRYAALARQAATEGIVLLKNDNDTLPLAAGSKMALFGVAQLHYYKSGTGSGGLVNTRHVPDLPEVLSGENGYQLDAEVQARYTAWGKDHPYDEGGGWAQEPWFQPEMPLDEAFVQQAAQRCGTAIVVIGRTAGEDRDNSAEPGSFLLTKEEDRVLALVCRHFARSIVLLNTGNILDMQWVKRYNPQSVLYIWQGGQEGAHAVLDMLNGTVSPCGKLPDTIALTPNDYPAAEHYGSCDRNFYTEDIYVGYRWFETFAPEKTLYPFGFGLSYTTFSIELLSSDVSSAGISAVVCVKNTGPRPGKEVVQLYGSAPQGKLGKPGRVLCAFAKTSTLAPGEEQYLLLQMPWQNLASYDDSGATGYKSAWVLEEGGYHFYLGTDVHSAVLAFSVTLPFRVLEQLSSAAGPTTPFNRLRPAKNGSAAWEPVPLQAERPESRRAGHLPADLAQTRDKGIRLAAVAAGTATMADFIAQLRNEELCTIVRGEGMNSPRVTPGTAGAIGGVSEALQHYGIPPLCCSDGPSGIRMDCGAMAFSLPNGTCLASSFNEALNEELYSMTALELRAHKIDTLLGPGINIHRHPLNGRNFEYFSEDPLLTGKMACAQLRGLHRWGVTGTIKHFACNNQEYCRHDVESIVSERALREIYLRGFEIAVKEGHARSIMTSYNPLNGYWTAGNYDLVTTILHKQWGFTGLVMSDWGAKANIAGCEGSSRHVAAMVRAQNDVFMVVQAPEHNSGLDDLADELAAGHLTLGELQRSAANICRFALHTPAFLHSIGQYSLLDEQLASTTDDAPAVDAADAIAVTLDVCTELDVARIDRQARHATTFSLQAAQDGQYQLRLQCKAEDGSSPLAQIPVSIFADRKFISTITLLGKQTNWQEFTLPLPYFHAKEHHSISFYFAQSGMELRAVTVELIE